MQSVTCQDTNAAGDVQLVRHFLCISERFGPAVMVDRMYSFVAGAAHGAEAEPREGTATGAALATPHE